MANFELTNDIIGLLVDFPSHKEVTIESLISNKGHNCITYSGKINSGNEPKCIVKEYAPENFTRDNKIFENNKYFNSRVLPAQFEDFEKHYNEFVKQLEILRNKIQVIIDEESPDSEKSLKNYIINIPDGDNCRFFIDKSNKCYSGLMLYPYESTDAEEKIKDMSLTERLESLIMLCKIVHRFHEKHIALVDLKPMNFIYYNDGINKTVKLFDFDSIVQIDDNGFINESDFWRLKGTHFFSAPETLSDLGTQNYDAGIGSDIYSLGAMLLYYVLIDDFNELIPDVDYFKISDLNDILSNEIFNKYQKAHKSKNTITYGFWRRFVSIIKTSMNEDIFSRSFGQNLSVLPLEKEIGILLDIYNHKGVHPEVMFDYACEMAEDPNFLKVYEEELLCDIEEVN